MKDVDPVDLLRGVIARQCRNPLCETAFYRADTITVELRQWCPACNSDDTAPARPSTLLGIRGF